jgi:murein DD-endopeptidase MepM/ murein hydrolase activator NlpD
MIDRPPSRNPDHPSAKSAPLGNHVVIRTTTNDGDAYLFMCHMQQGSVRVVPGQVLDVHDRIGNCGNSGRTTTPHLHMHIQKEPQFAFNIAIGVPFCFAPSAGPPYPGVVVSSA